MKKEKTKVIYQVKYEKINNLLEQVNWSDEVIKEALNEEKEKSWNPTTQGEIRKYMRGDGKKGLCLVLQRTNMYQSMVLICPLYLIQSKNNYLNGYNIGIIPELSIDFEVLAGVHDIRFLKKNRIFWSGKDEQAMAYVLKDHLINILYLYKSLIEKIMEIPVKYENVHIC